MKIWKITKTVFWSAIIVASIFIILTSLNIFGLQMFVVKSGSMEPSIHTGSVVIDQKADKYGVGDVITFRTMENDDTITHRVYKQDGKYFTTKGDANQAIDSVRVLDANIIGKVWFSIPFVGYLITFIRTLPGLIIFILIPAVIIVAEEISNIKTEVARIRTAKNKVVEEVEKIEEMIIKEEKKIKKSTPKKKEAKNVK
jgi:signal peptidase